MNEKLENGQSEGNRSKITGQNKQKWQQKIITNQDEKRHCNEIIGQSFINVKTQ